MCVCYDMNKREFARKERISKVYNTLLKAKKQKKEIKIRLFKFEIMNEFNVTSRLAKEYIDVAEARIDAKENNLK